MNTNQVKQELKKGRILKIIEYPTMPDYLLYKDSNYEYYQIMDGFCNKDTYNNISIVWGIRSTYEFISKSQFFLEIIKENIRATTICSSTLNLYL